MTRYRFLFLVLGCLLSLPACQNPKNHPSTITSNQYAKGFSISETENYITVLVFNPWQQDKILCTYYLVQNNEIETPHDGVRIRIPITRISVTSCTHIGFLKALDQLASIYGICSPEIVYNQEVLSSKDGHKVIHTGDALNPDIERILHSSPDAVMVSTYAQGDAATAKIQTLGLPIIYNNEWTENHPLGRAEWLRFVGAFYDCLPKADSIFESVVASYKAMKATTDTLTHRRTILSGSNFRGTWYMPTGGTYMGKLFADAGADYFYLNDSSQFSIPLDIETVIRTFQEAEVWVGCPANSLEELAQIDEKHTWFNAYKNQQVYNFAKRTTPSGGNDFWETGVVRPDSILYDLIHILYPHLLLPDTDKAMPFIFTEHLQ